MTEPTDHPTTQKPLVTAIVLLMGLYGLTVFCWGPESLSLHHASHGEDHAAHGEATQPGSHAEPLHSHTQPGRAHGEGSNGSAKDHITIPHLFAVAPFVLLLGAIALLPLISATEHWWEKNSNRFLTALLLAGVTLAYYGFLFDGGGKQKVVSVLQHAILAEYIPFIVLLFSLYTISGGIRISGDLVASPLTNTCFLLVGGLLASFVGTTGAAMLLIRPLIETNHERKHVQHTVVFFIFVVCNCGGCLLPIGDPPLFLGYLKGVSFLWTMEHLWVPWLVANALILLIYFLWDTLYFHPKESRFDVRRDVVTVRPLRIAGLMPNALLLIGVILSIAFLDPTKTVPGTLWHPWPFLREVVQLVMVMLSLVLGQQRIRQDNRFNYHAILEVAALFVGIFICMQPAIEILHVKGGQLGLQTPQQLYWATGGLSSVLDNAPTYVVFFETAAADLGYSGEAFARLVSESSPVATEAIRLLMGISLGAVFMGSMTYIGNGPNFMVRAIAEQSGVKMPSFFGYFVRYSAPVLLPVFFIVAWIFLR